MTKLIAKALRVVTRGGEEQNFLGNSFIPTVLDVLPESVRPSAAKYALSISPHYYVTGLSVDAEHVRLRKSRHILIDSLIRPYLKLDMSVVDFGCGPGYACYEISPLCKTVAGVDISRGALACARIINNRPNISYHSIAGKSLQDIFQTGSVDLVFSFAVLQHLSDEQCRDVARQWFSILRDDGLVVCHVPLSDNRSSSEVESGASNVDGKKVHKLRFQFRSSDQVRSFVEPAGFRKVDFVAVSDLCKVEDDIQGDHLMICRK